MPRSTAAARAANCARLASGAETPSGGDLAKREVLRSVEHNGNCAVHDVRLWLRPQLNRSTSVENCKADHSSDKKLPDRQECNPSGGRS